jgi:hypothetical protein
MQHCLGPPEGPADSQLLGVSSNVTRDWLIWGTRSWTCSLCSTAEQWCLYGLLGLQPGSEAGRAQGGQDCPSRRIVFPGIDVTGS